jgi:hypothetical protein
MRCGEIRKQWGEIQTKKAKDKVKVESRWPQERKMKFKSGMDWPRTPTVYETTRTGRNERGA